MKTKIITQSKLFPLWRDQLIIVCLFLIFNFPFLIGFAQGCHGGGGSSSHNMSNKDNTAAADNPNKYAMNDGTVKKAGKYHIEMVYQPLLAKDPLAFYLMNKKGKPVSNQGITGKAEITYADKSTGEITLEARGENGFAGQMLNKAGSFICFLTLQINGENINARFDGSAAGKENAAASGYTCPMHPEVKSDQPDSCPKCGMSLVKKSDASGMKMKCGMMGGMSMAENKEQNNSAPAEKTSIVKDSIIYTCSMHPEVKLASAGACPKCGMALVKAEQAKAIYECPMKCEGDKTYDTKTNCPKCGMNLEKKTVQPSESKTEKKETAKMYGCCPMCPDVKSDKPGKCPKCGMDLKEIQNK